MLETKKQNAKVREKNCLKDVEKFMSKSHIYNLLMTQIKVCDYWQFL